MPENSFGRCSSPQALFISAIVSLLPIRERSRVVQRSIHDTHTEDRADAAKGDAMASVCDIANAVEAQDVGGERAQACKDARIAADAAGVFCEATVADVVRAVFYAPVVADGLGTLSGWQHDVTDEQCNFAGRAPQPSDCGAGENVAIDADHRADVAVPLGVCLLYTSDAADD